MQSAVFLDVDGTLVDFLDEPEAVSAPPSLKKTLAALAKSLHGALALISGRTLASLDRVFDPIKLPAAGVHGAERRDFDGRLHQPLIRIAPLAEFTNSLQPLLRLDSGLRVEFKRYSVALHYRSAVHLESDLSDRFLSLARAAGPDFEVVPGSCVLELRSRMCHKGRAIEAFMAEQPFAGRTPIFVGDDNTDQDAIDAVRRLGGRSFAVGTRVLADAAFANPAEVRDWLAEAAAHLSQRHA